LIGVNSIFTEQIAHMVEGLREAGLPEEDKQTKRLIAIPPQCPLQRLEAVGRWKDGNFRLGVEGRRRVQGEKPDL
jgi:hypothetical protein